MLNSIIITKSNCDMKSMSLQKNTEKLHLKVIKSPVKRKKSVITKFYINTLIPGFTYLNNKGKIVTPRNCAY